MTPAEGWRVLAVVAAMMLGLPLVRRVALRHGLGPEVSRKAVHVGMGLVCAGLPWVFGRPLPVWLLAAAVTAWLAVIRAAPGWAGGAGAVLHGIGRLSYGELLFAPAVATVFQLAHGDPLLHAIPIGILAVADAAGALAGTRWGKRHYGSGHSRKTVIGSLAFLAAAFGCTVLPLVVCGRTDPLHALWIGLILATLGMMAEGIADRGFDNLVIPLLCLFVLGRLLPLEMPALIGRFAVAAGLLALVLGGSRWSSLNGGALLGGALLGYACAVVADWRFVLPPLAVFGCHLLTTRRFRLTERYEHRLDVVLAHALGCLPWVILTDRDWLASGTCLAGISFAMATQLALLDAMTRLRLSELTRNPVVSTAKGWLVAGLPGLVWLAGEWRALVLPGAVAVAGTFGACLILPHLLRCSKHRESGLRLAKGALALAVSAAALLPSL